MDCCYQEMAKTLKKTDPRLHPGEQTRDLNRQKGKNESGEDISQQPWAAMRLTCSRSWIHNLVWYIFHVNISKARLFCRFEWFCSMLYLKELDVVFKLGKSTFDIILLGWGELLMVMYSSAIAQTKAMRHIQVRRAAGSARHAKMLFLKILSSAASKDPSTSMK